jgi:hypothetical protein
MVATGSGGFGVGCLGWGATRRGLIADHPIMSVVTAGPAVAARMEHQRSDREALSRHRGT